MKYISNSHNLIRVARDVSKDIEDKLDKLGLMYRIIYRPKDIDKAFKKIEDKKYSISNKKLQDLIGIRVTVFFEDDLDLVYGILRKADNFVDETIDNWKDFEFKPIRVNLIFKLVDPLRDEVNKTINLYGNLPIDSTYEVQLRTVLSEGWHEVDHDLRYKCRNDWEGFSDLSRNFNSILATLQLSDWGIKKIFDELSLAHFQNRNWEAMLRHQFRIRLSDKVLSTEVLKEFNDNSDFGKKVFNVDRIKFLNTLSSSNVNIPLTLNNLVFLLNYFYVKNQKITSLTPESLYKSFS